MTEVNGVSPVEQAMEWLVRRSGGPVSAAEGRAFDAWLAASPDHAQAYAEAESLWASLDWSETLNQNSLRQSGVSTLATVSSDRRAVQSMRPRLTRRSLMGLAAGLAVVAATPVAMLAMGRATRRFETEVGEIRHMALQDGSRVSMGGQSVLATRINDAERLMRLDAGEAFFNVAHDETRVFKVVGAGLTAEALGTAFEVKIGEKGPEVFVEEGRVKVTASGARLILGAGERAVLHEGVLRRSAISLAAVAPWRRQRFSFIDQPLSGVVADVNRYYRPGVKIISPELAAQKVTAAFTIEQIPQAMDSLVNEMGGRLIRRENATGDIEIVLKR